MNFLVIGDVVGRTGRTALKENLKKIQDQFKISFTIINAENSAGGYGLTGKIYEDLISWGADAIIISGSNVFSPLGSMIPPKPFSKFGL